MCCHHGCAFRLKKFMADITGDNMPFKNLVMCSEQHYQRYHGNTWACIISTGCWYRCQCFECFYIYDFSVTGLLHLTFWWGHLGQNNRNYCHGSFLLVRAWLEICGPLGHLLIHIASDQLGAAPAIQSFGPLGLGPEGPCIVIRSSSCWVASRCPPVHWIWLLHIAHFISAASGRNSSNHDNYYYYYLSKSSAVFVCFIFAPIAMCWKRFFRSAFVAPCSVRLLFW